jgi:origin recognition complex subunit 3
VVVEDKELSEYPDTSILLQRYLESGKMINVYDWFESFQPPLETQRDLVTNTRRKSPQKAKANERRKKPTAEEEEKWKLLVQARFIRGLHELDYLGFLKHTKRKPDHVLRTCFDLSDIQ